MTLGGVVDLFLRRPATGGSLGESSEGGEPDIGGEGRGAQLGAGVVFDKLRSNPSFCEPRLDLCSLNERSNEGSSDSRDDFMRLTAVTTLIPQTKTSSYRSLKDPRIT